ncbi:type II toxin-antitoxin system VapC family toxin [Candidatus Woesearchaeota archaeon]|nr:type II toxin-antitoxin system VapC family toxin [Candidatus Woesearchaeota archaeon]
MYIDANIFAFAAMLPGAEGAKARKLLETVVKGRKALTSALTIDEVMWVLRKSDRATETRTVVENIYALPNLEIKEVAASLPLRALDFMERHKLKPRDALHLAAMEQFNIHEIASDDADFDRIPGIKRMKL